MACTKAQGEWARCRPWIVAALLRSPQLETIGDVERLIGQGRYQFWPGRRSAAITEIVEFQRAKALVVRHAGGDLEELTNNMEPAFCAFARAHGCTKIMGEGREGWKRVCRRMGYALGFVVMVKDLQ
jgi:hypothetical protein